MVSSPGFIDSHGHMAGLGRSARVAQFPGSEIVAAVAEMVRKAAKSRPKGEWIRGRAWDQTEWGGSFPPPISLDKAAPDHPVYLSRVDGHAAWVNTPRARTRRHSAPNAGSCRRQDSPRPVGKGDRHSDRPGARTGRFEDSGTDTGTDRTRHFSRCAGVRPLRDYQRS